MLLNQYGEIIQSCWSTIPSHYPNVSLDSFIIMPNHVHGIIIIKDSVNVAGLKPAPLSEIIRAFKTFSARRINKTRTITGVLVWQRNYYEHIIRNEKELSAIREYIVNNVIAWESDKGKKARPNVTNSGENT